MSKIDAALPTMVNDSGTGRDGTREDVAFFETWRDAVNGQTYSAANPTVTPADIIDEVVTARGSIATLDGRLDVEHNNDGTHKNTGVIATLITETQFMGGLGGVNLIQNDDFLCWHLGDSLAPTSWTLAGAAAVVERCGTGLGDTNRKVGDFCARVTRAGTNCSLTNTLLSGAAFTRANFLKGKTVAMGAWVMCATPNVARVSIADNVGTTYSSYHTGTGLWEFLACTRTIDNSATAIIPGFSVFNADVAAYFSGATAILTNANTLLLKNYQPSPVTYGVAKFGIAGNLSIATQVDSFVPARAGIIKYVEAYVKTAPAATDIIFDVNTSDGTTPATGANLVTAFTTKPTILATANFGGAAPDGTYARRCLSAAAGATIGAGGLLTLDVDQIGTGTVGADASIQVRILQYSSPLERFQDS